jgi:hypothetical protein
MKAALPAMIALSIAWQVGAVNSTTARAQSLDKLKPPAPDLPENDKTNTAVPALLPKLDLLAGPVARTRSHGTKEAIAGTQPDTSAEILRPVRADAMRSPLATKILLETGSASTPELRRYLLRLYVSTICKRMRGQKPNLAPVIGAFEKSQLEMISRSKSPHVTQDGVVEDGL